MKTVLVTGATGFVGFRVCEWLAEAGYQVKAGVRSLDSKAPRHANIEVVVLGDLESLDLTSSLLLRVDIVVHCAGRAHVMKEFVADPLEAFRRVNVVGTQRLAQAAAHAGVKQFIFLSSIKVNGEATTTRPFMAEDPSDPQDPYAVSKWEAEIWLQDYFSARGISLITIRPVLMIGPGVKGNFETLCRWVHKGVPLPVAKLSNRRSVLCRDNLCQLILAAIRHPEVSGTFLAADRQAFSTPELVQAIAKAFGKKAALFSLPYSLLRFLCFLTNKQSTFKRLSESLVVDITLAEKVLGWIPEDMLENELKNISLGLKLYKK